MSSVRLLVVLGVGVIALGFLVFAYDPGAVQPVPRHGAPTAAAVGVLALPAASIATTR